MRDAAEQRVENGHASSRIVQEALARFAGGTSVTKQKQIATAKLAPTIAANLPVRRSASEGGKELGYDG
jgi:hypothetical protein